METRPPRFDKHAGADQEDSSMIQTSVAAFVPLRPPPEHPETESLDPLLQSAADIESSYVLIIAEHGLDLLCALIRRGCIAAAAVRPHEKADLEAYNLVLAPFVTDLPSLDDVIRVARRSLSPHGRLIVGLLPDPAGRDLSLALARRLRLNGFAALRTVTFPRIIVLQADLQVQRNSSFHIGSGRSS
jgi:hypothetical protein